MDALTPLQGQQPLANVTKQARIEPAERAGQAEQVKHRRMKIVDVHFALDGAVPKVVRIAVGQTAFHSASGHLG